MNLLRACLVATFAAAITTAAPGTALADEEGTGPVVELSADEGNATLEKRTGTTAPSLGLLETGVLAVGEWQHACVALCQMRLDPRFTYRVAGDGLVPTASFVLPRGEDRVRVDARMGSSPARVSGMLLTGAGAAALALGGAALIASPILASEDVGSEGFRSAVLAGGIGAVSVGVIAATVGLFMWVSNGSSAHPRAVASAASSSSASSSPSSSSR